MDEKNRLNLKIFEENNDIFRYYLVYLESFLKDNGENYKENYVEQCYNFYSLNKYGVLKNWLRENADTDAETRIKSVIKDRFKKLYEKN